MYGIVTGGVSGTSEFNNGRRSWQQIEEAFAVYCGAQVRRLVVVQEVARDRGRGQTRRRWRKSNGL